MFRRVTLALLTLALLCGPAAAAEKFIVASDCTWPPMEMLDANKQPEGFSTDYLRAMGKAAGFEVEVRNIAWDGHLWRRGHRPVRHSGLLGDHHPRTRKAV